MSILPFCSIKTMSLIYIFKRENIFVTLLDRMVFMKSCLISMQTSWIHNINSAQHQSKAYKQHNIIEVAFGIQSLVYFQKHNSTRWTFFRVKLVFEYDFEISWSFGPWVLGTLRPSDLGILGLLDLFPPPQPPPPPLSSYYLLVWYGMVWFALV